MDITTSTDMDNTDMDITTSTDMDNTDMNNMLHSMLNFINMDSKEDENFICTTNTTSQDVEKENEKLNCREGLLLQLDSVSDELEKYRVDASKMRKRITELENKVKFLNTVIYSINPYMRR